jgi:hypothetical protein
MSRSASIGHELKKTWESICPSDYKRFLERYGMGEIDNFIYLFHPTTQNPHINLKKQIVDNLWALREVRDSDEHVPFPIFPEPRGVVPWSRTANGDVCYGLTDGPDPDSWMVVINESRGPDWEEYHGSATEFLAEVLSARQGWARCRNGLPLTATRGPVHSQSPANSGGD